MRPDLSIRPQQVAGRRYWVVKDPVALRYFHLREEEHAILKMLDGRISLQQIKRRFEKVFAPLQMSVEHLQGFLARLHRCSLVLSDAPGQADELTARHGRRRREARMQAALSILAIRFRGIDPEGLLRWLYPRCRWLFSAWFLGACLLLAVSAVLLAAVELGALQEKLPDFRSFFSPRNAVWLAVALIVIKVFHELGHALACKHFGGECHEMGFMLLVFVPCLYCDVSDAWMLSSKWRRIAVSAAGICVEIALASICTFLWWFSEPGLLNTLCLNVMFICSVSTVLLNGNPLLRYDGYYMLSDLVEVPNLYQQSRALVSRGLRRWLLGTRPPEDRSLPEQHRFLLALYAVASTLYRWIVVVAILWFCHRVLQPYRLELLAWALAAVVVIGLLVVPVASGVRLLRDPARRSQIRRGRALLSFALVLAVVVGIGLVPLPFRVTAPVRLDLQGGHRVYVSVPGRLVKCARPGAVVRRGQTLAELEDLDVRRQIEDLTGKRNRQRLHKENLRLRLAEDPSVGSQIPAAEEALADIEARLLERSKDHGRLILKAPADGTVLPPPARADPPDTLGRLSEWRGNPLQRRNLGCYLRTGTLFCLVGIPSGGHGTRPPDGRLRLQAVLLIEQSDLKFVRIGQRVRIQLDELLGEILGGTIREIAKMDLPKGGRGKGEGGVSLPPPGFHFPASRETSYQVRVQLDEHEHVLLAGSRGRAKILADPQSLFQRIRRQLRRTFSITL